MEQSSIYMSLGAIGSALIFAFAYWYTYFKNK